MNQASFPEFSTLFNILHSYDAFIHILHKKGAISREIAPFRLVHISLKLPKDYNQFSSAFFFFSTTTIASRAAHAEWLVVVADDNVAAGDFFALEAIAKLIQRALDTGAIILVTG